MRATYLEVDRPGRLAWIEPASGMTTSVTFVDLGDGRTEVVTHQTHVPDAYLSPEARTGFESSLDKADRYLDRQAQVAVELPAPGRRARSGRRLGRALVVRGAGGSAEVVAHLTMPARYDEAAFLAELEADGYDFTTLSNRIATRDAAAVSTATLLANLRDPVLHRWQPPGGGAAGALNHAVVHSLDVTVPLGLARPDPDVAVRLVLGDLLAGGAAHFGVDPATVDPSGPDATPGPRADREAGAPHALTSADAVPSPQRAARSSSPGRRGAARALRHEWGRLPVPAARGAAHRQGRDPRTKGRLTLDRHRQGRRGHHHRRQVGPGPPAAAGADRRRRRAAGHRFELRPADPPGLEPQPAGQPRVHGRVPRAAPPPTGPSLLTGDARAAAWATAVDFYAGYEQYRTRCAPREIRVFRLRPA